MARTVNVVLTEEFQEENAHNTANVNAAVGYLTLWAVTSERYASLALYGDKRGDLNATYRDKAGDVTYSIFGQRGDDGAFSFHS